MQSVEKADKMSINRIVYSYWPQQLEVDLSPREILKSLIETNSDESFIEELQTASNGGRTQWNHFHQKYKTKLDSLVTQSCEEFCGFVNRYSGRDAVIVTCLFGPQKLSGDAGEQLTTAMDAYITEQAENWKSLTGHATDNAALPDWYLWVASFLVGAIASGLAWDALKLSLRKLIPNDSTIPETEILNRLKSLNLSEEEMGQVRTYFDSNVDQYFGSLTQAENRYLDKLMDGPVRTDEAPPSGLSDLEYVYSVSLLPGERSVVFWPKSIRFFEVN